MAFWWEEKKDNKNKIPSLDTGVTNAKCSFESDFIFSSENFKNISSMFDEMELKIAFYKAQKRTHAEIAEILGISAEEVGKKVRFMSSVYRKTFPDESQKTNFRTIISPKGR